jgi:secondary thiamine-phosphate synthase enzyme
MTEFTPSSRWSAGRERMHMKQYMAVLGFDTPGRALVDITLDLRSWLRDTDVRIGLLSLFCQHTSASILVCENVSPAVREDLMKWFDKAVPDGTGYTHDAEGPDDMPAHIRSVLTGASVSIPVADGRMMLGQWQGVFLAEHRTAPQKRSVAVRLIGE